MVDNNEEKLDNKANETENNEDFISPDLLEEAEVYLAEEESAEAREFIRDEEIKTDGKLLHYTKVVLSGILDQIFAIGLALIIFGILVLANPFASLTITKLVGSFLILASILDITDLILLKNKSDEITKIFW